MSPLKKPIVAIYNGHALIRSSAVGIIAWMRYNSDYKITKPLSRLPLEHYNINRYAW